MKKKTEPHAKKRQEQSTDRNQKDRSIEKSSLIDNSLHERSMKASIQHTAYD